MSVKSLLLLCGGGLVAKSCPALETPWTVACQAPLPIFHRQEYWSEWLLSSPGLVHIHWALEPDVGLGHCDPQK